ncbi:triacylglycerol lipase, partial [uncultured Aeromicrobium sp.]|uniref:esterase/lipase family protein n=1 Tax=uncultured Aeromicrobium sp. TaxID=337820 RepID=UPI0025EF275E
LSRRGVGRPVDDTAAGRRFRAVVNGLMGERLRAIDDPHALTMEVRLGGRNVPVTAWALREAFADATGHVVLLVHGLCHDDECWQRDAAIRPTYLDLIRDETDSTPVVLRYNTGLSVGENGRLLADLVGALVAQWPERVARITFVAHTMGALVARACLSQAAAAHADWIGLVRDMVCLGSPHIGAPWEKATAVSTAVASGLGRFRPARRGRESPSGANAPRLGLVDGEVWEGHDVTARWGRERRAVAPLPHVAYRFVISDDGPLGDHALVNHPVVGEHLVGWLRAREAHRGELTAR